MVSSKWYLIVGVAWCLLTGNGWRWRYPVAAVVSGAQTVMLVASAAGGPLAVYMSLAVINRQCRGAARRL